MSTVAYRALLVVHLRPVGAHAAKFAALERIREAHDHAFERWRPHLTLIPPFVFDADVPGLNDRMDALCDALAPVCAATPPHILTLGQIGSFRLSRYHNIHLRPTDQTALASLHAALCAAARGHVPARALRTKGFTAHASLGQSYSAADKREICTAASEAVGLDVAVDSVQVMYKEASVSGPYALWRELPLEHALGDT
ncbi:hypothetical protein MCUN1_002229 [Malassezia cuniculi]|uniref:2'-5' RNA ligase family protein n=1 Tax=Malassezia cuniculi TaxID=948313 RepID=A0AAF0EUP0_9BASI|nr:hypothetical protein MCUN1_002229 [Malassezia cuniculi]